MLALLLAMGGAWAQGPTQVTEITTDMLPASWATDDNDLTLADLQALGFGAVDASVAQAWTGAPQGEYSVLIYGFDAGYFTYILFDDNGHANLPSHTGYSKRGLYENVAYGNKHFFTAAQEIELTKAGANQWTLGQTPDYDLELQVEYYEAHALKNIPAGWTVKVNGVDKTAAIDGDSLKITETAQVLLTPDHPERVKKVILVEEAVLVNIDGITLDITGCTTWADIIARNPGVLENDGDWIAASGRGFLYLGDLVFTDNPYDPAQQSNYHWVLL